MNTPESLLLLACLVASAWLIVRAAIRDHLAAAQRVIDDAMRYDLDDCVSKRPEDDDETKWHAEYDKWVREEKARPYDWQEGGL
jgi:hypothetical protein